MPRLNDDREIQLIVGTKENKSLAKKTDKNVIVDPELLVMDESSIPEENNIEEDDNG